MNATAKGFAVFGRQNITVAAGQAQRLDIPLEIEVEKQNITIEEEAPTVEVAPENNASAIIIKGKDLEALSDDPDELQAELQALAGPSAGPNGGQIYIDGFTGVSFRRSRRFAKSASTRIHSRRNTTSSAMDVSRSSPSQVRINITANSCSTITIRPSMRPILFSPGEPPSYNTELFNGYISGPLSKAASFFVNIQRRNINDPSVVDVPFDPVTGDPFSEAFPNSKTRTNISPRIDLQLGQKNTLMIRYQFTQNNEINDGVGQLALPSQAYNVSDTEQTLQISDTQIISPNVVNETRFQYIRERNNQTAQILYGQPYPCSANSRTAAMPWEISSITPTTTNCRITPRSFMASTS